MIQVHSEDSRIAVPENPDTGGPGNSLAESLRIALLDRDWEEKGWERTSFQTPVTVPFLETYSTKAGKGHGLLFSSGCRACVCSL